MGRLRRIQALRPLTGLRETALVEAPPASVWALLRDVAGWARWHRAAHATGNKAPDPGPSVRFALAPDLEAEAALLALSDQRQVLRLVLTAPEPLAGVGLLVRLWPVTEGGGCLVDWSLEVSAMAADAPLDALRTGLVQEGLRGLAAALGGRAGQGPASSAGATAPPAGAPPATQPYPSAPQDPAPRVSPPRIPTPRIPVPRPLEPRFAEARIPAPRLPEALQPRRHPGPARAAAVAAEPCGVRVFVMRAARPGGPEVLAPAWQDLPAPGPGEVLLAQAYAGVNFIDLACLAGSSAMMALPGVPGLEGAGVVQAVGAGVEDLVPGDRVGWLGPPMGGYASHLLLARAKAVRLPDGLPDPPAAALLLKGIMAGLLLHQVHRLQAGETVVVLSAAGGVGQMLVDWAESLGARVIAVVSGGQKAEALGVARPGLALIDRSATDLAEAVLALTEGRGADLVLDGVGRATLPRALAAARMGGHVISFGTASGAPAPVALETLAARSLTLSRPVFGAMLAAAGGLERAAGMVFGAVEAGRIAPPQPAILPLHEAARALEHLGSGRSIGAMVLDCRARPEGW